MTAGPVSRLGEGDPLPPEDRVCADQHTDLDALYRAQRPRLLRLLRRGTRNEDAEDTLQQSFLRLASLPEERVGRIVSPVAYLRRTLRNLVSDHSKAASRRHIGQHIPADDLDLLAPDQLAALEARDMLRRLETAMHKLKPMTREVFLAHRIDGYTYDEIAHRTGLSVKAVERRMAQAIGFINRFANRN